MLWRSGGRKPADRGVDRAARTLARRLATDGVRMVALTWVDNAGIVRAKAIPLHRLAAAAVHGTGVSAVQDRFCVDDSIAPADALEAAPVGDLRLHPDLDALVAWAGHPGWAWVPADRRTQNGQPYPGCHRGFALQAETRSPYTLKMATEIEFYLECHDGRVVGRSAYGIDWLGDIADFVSQLMDALDRQRVTVEQFHAEAGVGQFELVIAPETPVRAADLNVLSRLTIAAVANRHGMRVSFAPRPWPDRIGNGAHVHLSAWRDRRNLFAGGNGPHGLTQEGAALLAALVHHLPGLCAIGAPSVASYARLRPQQWAGAYQCWGHENRETAIRLAATGRPSSANVELRCFDGSANPYLAVGALAAILKASDPATRRADSGSESLTLPAEVVVDPASMPPSDRPPLLPDSLIAALAALEADTALRDALGEVLYATFTAVRRAEVAMFDGLPVEEIAAAVRWRY
jgi:glutamine synthetase